MREEVADEASEAAQNGLQGAADKTNGRGQHCIPGARGLVNQLPDQINGDAQSANNQTERSTHGPPQIPFHEDLPNQPHNAGPGLLPCFRRCSQLSEEWNLPENERNEEI